MEIDEDEEARQIPQKDEVNIKYPDRFRLNLSRMIQIDPD